VEARIGWHKNTGREARPVEFQPVADYREEYYRPGLLPQLFRKKSYVAEQPKDPVLRVWLEGGEAGPSPQLPGVTPVRGQVPVLHAAVVDFDPAKIAQVKWCIDEGKWQDFDTKGKGREVSLPE